MRRGEIWWADLPPPFGRRPAVLVSRDAALCDARVGDAGPTYDAKARHRGRSAAPTGGQRPPLLRRQRRHILTVPTSRLIRRIGPLTPKKLRAVEDALRFAHAL